MEVGSFNLIPGGNISIKLRVSPLGNSLREEVVTRIVSSDGILH